MQKRFQAPVRIPIKQGNSGRQFCRPRPWCDGWRVPVRAWQKGRSHPVQRTIWPWCISFVSRQILTSDLDEVTNNNRLPTALYAHAYLVIIGRTLGLELKSAFQKFLITDGGIHMEERYTERLEGGGYIHPETEIYAEVLWRKGDIEGICTEGGFYPGHGWVKPGRYITRRAFYLPLGL